MNRGFDAIKREWCHMCGACVGICPTDALRVVSERIEVNDRCTRCGLCYEICSGRGCDLPALYDRFFPEAQKDGHLGPWLSCHIGYSADPAVRDGGASGGIATQMLLHAMQTGLIDAACVIGMDPKQPIKAKPVIASTKEQIMAAAQSKYVIVPTLSILKEASKFKGNLGIVALPCQLQSLKLIAMKAPRLVANIKLQIGLFCGFDMHFEATTYVMKKLGVKEEDVASLKYRSGTWPGGMTFGLKNGTTRAIDIFHYHYLNAVFLPKRCRFCPDIFAECADISCGDSWLPRLYSKEKLSNKGWSSIVARTRTGKDLIASAIAQGTLAAEDVPPSDITGSFPFLVKYKKKGVFVRFKRMKEVGTAYRLAQPTLTLKERLYHHIFNTCLYFSATRFFKTFLLIFPMSWMRWLIMRIKYVFGYVPNARDMVLK